MDPPSHHDQVNPLSAKMPPTRPSSILSCLLSSPCALQQDRETENEMQHRAQTFNGLKPLVSKAHARHISVQGTHC